MTILKIAISFIVLFILPFILVAFKVFHHQDKLFQIYISMIIGLFSSVALVYLLGVFNVFNKINFIASYSLIIVVSNVYFLTQIKQPQINFRLRLSPDLLLILFAFGIGSYMRLYDPLQHVSLGTVDFYKHLGLLEEAADGQIFTIYPKGYHIILALIHFVSAVDFYTIVRFAGALFGIISIGAMYCFVKEVFSEKSAIFATLFYAGFTLFNYLTVEQTGSFPQGFGFVLIPFLVYFALELIHSFKESNVLKRNIIAFILIVFLLSLISPYAMLQMSYILYFLLFFSIAFHSSIRKHIRQFFRSAAALIILFSLGILIILSYYTVLSELRSTEIRLPIYDESKIVRLIEEGESKAEAMEKSARLANWTTNKWAVIKGLLRMKRFRVPVEFPLSISVYVGLLLSLFILVSSIRKRSLEFFAISVFIFLFGVSCITGILELPRYSGRSGWYFMLGSIWLGGIILKRFYNQELMRDISHILRRVIPLRIANRANSVKESRVSLIYSLLTLSILISYLAVIYVLGLYRLSPVRDLLFLLLIPIMILIASKKGRDILSGEIEPYSLHKNTRFYVSLHKSLVLTVVLVVMLYPLPRPPEYNFRYYHRSVNEDDFVKVLQKVKDKYPLSEVKMFFDSDIVYSAREKTTNMAYSQDMEIAKIEDSSRLFQKQAGEEGLFVDADEEEKKSIVPPRTEDKRYNFLFLDRKKEKSESLNKIRQWISRSEGQHDKVSLFYDSEKIVVYLIENYDVSGPDKN